MSHMESGTEYCPVCGKQVFLEELNVHVNNHFPSETPSPTHVPANDTVLNAFVVDSLKHEPDKSAAIEKRIMEMAYLPTEASHLKEVQTVDPCFQAGLNSLALFEEAYVSGRPLQNSHSVCFISGPLQHFCKSEEDRGWGCGYKNCQMLISHLLLRESSFGQVLFGGVEFVPDIPSLQAWLECAWKQGFDPTGKHILEGNVQGTTKWIGAIDIATLLRQFGVRVRFIDFLGRQSLHHPSYEGGTVHEGLSCDFCLVQPIVGKRYMSQNIENFDLCEHCAHLSSAENFAPFVQCGNREIQIGTTCRGCRMSPILGVRYQKRQDWRVTLCINCYQRKSGLEQTLYKPCHRSRKRRASGQGHETLMRWVWNYFAEVDASSQDNGQDVETQRKLVTTEKAPLFFQHEGHSRTIVGIERVITRERHSNTTYSLLIFDPTTNSDTLQKSFRQGRWPHVIKRGVHTLHQSEFTILYIEDGIASESERESLKEVGPQEPVLAEGS